MEHKITNPCPKKILFIYHRLDTIGGIETRFIDEFHFLRKNHYKVVIAVPKNKIKADVLELLPVDELITPNVGRLNCADNFIELVNFIAEVIRTKNIDLLSIHMFNDFSFASIIAAQLCQIPVISTLHGTPDIYLKPIERIIFQGLASQSISLSVSVSKHLHVISNSKAPTSRIIPNLINISKYKPASGDSSSAWLIVSRISFEKFPAILAFLKVAQTCNIKHIDLAGGGTAKARKSLNNKIESLNLSIRLNFLGEINDIASLIPQYYGIAGIGRVAIEGLACQKPVCILTSDGKLIGLVTVDNFSYLKEYNFTGKTLVSVDANMFRQQVENHTLEDSKRIYELLKASLSTLNWNEYIDKYNQVKFIPNEALEALYHKLDYFSKTISRPFLKDKLFLYLLEETLMEYDLQDIKTQLSFYQINYGLNNKYPNPIKYNFKTSIKKRLLGVFGR